MAKLGDAFSDDERRKSAERQLEAGLVIYLEVVFPEGPRPKYLVVAHVDAQCCTLIVNSRVHPFVEAHKELAVCQVRLDAARHPFLNHDSFVACHQVLRLPTKSVLADLAADLGRIKGRVHADAIAEIVAAIKRAPTLSATEQTAIAKALTGT